MAHLIPTFNYKWTLDRLQGGRPRDVASGAAVAGGGGVVLDPEEEVRCLARDEEEVLEKVLEACSDCHLCGHFGRRFAVEFSRPAA